MHKHGTVLIISPNNTVGMNGMLSALLLQPAIACKKNQCREETVTPGFEVYHLRNKISNIHRDVLLNGYINSLQLERYVYCATQCLT